MRFMADYCHSIGINRTLGKMWDTSLVPDTLNVRVFEDPNRYDLADSDSSSSDSDDDKAGDHEVERRPYRGQTRGDRPYREGNLGGKEPSKLIDSFKATGGSPL
jgi:hypothetical protein